MTAPPVLADPNIAAWIDQFLTPRRIAARDVERAWLETGERRQVRQAGQALLTWSWGTGPRVLLCHGWDSRGSHLGACLQPLLAAGLSASLYDAPAHGDSPGERSNVVELGRTVLSVAEALGPLAGLISHSAGSAASLWAFGHGLRVRASVHIAGPSSLRNVLRGFMHAHGLPQEALPEFSRQLESAIGCAIDELGPEALLPHLNHPMLFVHDRDDREIPLAESQRLQLSLPQAALEVTQGLGHRRIIGDPAVVAQAVTFLHGQIVGPL